MSIFTGNRNPLTVDGNVFNIGSVGLDLRSCDQAPVTRSEYTHTPLLVPSTGHQISAIARPGYSLDVKEWEVFDEGYIFFVKNGGTLRSAVTSSNQSIIRRETDGLSHTNYHKLDDLHPGQAHSRFV